MHFWPLSSAFVHPKYNIYTYFIQNSPIYRRNAAIGAILLFEHQNRDGRRIVLEITKQVHRVSYFWRFQQKIHK